MVTGEADATPSAAMPEGSDITRLINTKGILDVKPYNGDKVAFQEWKWHFLIALRAISKPLHDALKRVEDNIGQYWSLARQSEQERNVAEQLYTVLALLCKDDAMQYVRGAEEGN
eukprot:2521005-Amphidinium_carterae.1